jgi:hypothetical protein
MVLYEMWPVLRHREAKMSEDFWHGVPEGDTDNHRTVGKHRAWCHNDKTWCYPHQDGWCPCCLEAKGYRMAMAWVKEGDRDMDWCFGHSRRVGEICEGDGPDCDASGVVVVRVDS